jgi:hypothetical protein
MSDGNHSEMCRSSGIASFVVGHGREMAFEGVYAVRPEPPVRCEPRVDLGKWTRVQLVPAALRLGAHLHEARLAQHPQVLGRARLRQPEPLAQLADEMRPLQQDVEDASPGRLGQHVEYRHHEPNIRVEAYTGKDAERPCTRRATSLPGRHDEELARELVTSAGERYD